MAFKSDWFITDGFLVFTKVDQMSKYVAFGSWEQSVRGVTINVFCDLFYAAPLH